MDLCPEMIGSFVLNHGENSNQSCVMAVEQRKKKETI